MATTPPAKKNEKPIDDNINAATIPDQSSSEEYIISSSCTKSSNPGHLSLSGFIKLAEICLAENFLSASQVSGIHIYFSEPHQIE